MGVATLRAAPCSWSDSQGEVHSDRRRVAGHSRPLAAMAICQRPARGTAAAQTLADLFGGDSWRDGVTAADSDTRLNQAIPLIAQATGAKWWTSAVRIVSGGQATRYLLLHLTNSDDGRDSCQRCGRSAKRASTHVSSGVRFGSRSQFTSRRISRRFRAAIRTA